LIFACQTRVLLLAVVDVGFCALAGLMAQKKSRIEQLAEQIEKRFLLAILAAGALVLALIAWLLFGGR
jgi:cation transport ATPase